MINKSDIKPLTPEEEKMIEGHIKEFSGFYNKINKRNSEVIWETWNKNDNFYLQFAKDYSKKEHSIKFKGLIVINGEEVQVQQETWAKNMDECFFEKTLSRVLNLATELTGQISAQLILECSPREKRLYIRTNNIGDKLLYDLYLLITFSNNTTQFLCGRDIVELGKWQVNIEKKEISTIELIVDKSSFDKKNLNNLLENSSEILIKNYKLISITQEIFSLSTMAEEKNEIEIEQEIVQNNNDWGQIKIKCSWESNMVLIEEFEHLNSPLPGEIAYFIEFCDTKTQEAFSEMIKIDPFKIPESGIFLDKKQIQFNPLETDWLLLLSMIKTK